MIRVDFVMTVSGNGQVLIPAEVRAPWRADARLLSSDACAGAVVIPDATDSAMPVAHLTSAIEDRAVEVQLALAGRGQPRAPSIPDLLIAATAEIAGHGPAR